MLACLVQSDQTPQAAPPVLAAKWLKLQNHKHVIKQPSQVGWLM